MRTQIALLAAAALASGCTGPGGAAAVATREIEYAQDGTVLQGFLAFPVGAGPRPGVIVIHEWWGHNDHARRQAVRLAEAGYCAFALDLYGKGKLAEHPKDAQAFVEAVTKEQGLLAKRFRAGLKALHAQKEAAPGRTAALGYCFGGTVALTLACEGEPLDAVVAYHAALAPVPAPQGKPKARIRVHTGGDDPMIPAADVAAFEARMKGLDCRVTTYPGVRHSFTNPDADKRGMEALRYDAAADRLSWAATLLLLKGTFRE